MAYEYNIEDIVKYNSSIVDALKESNIPNRFKANDKETDLIGTFLNEKSSKIKDTIGLIWILINEREKIKGKVLDGLDTQIIQTKNLVLMAEPLIPGYTRLTRTQTELEKEVFKLEKAKLDEEVASWRDVLGLKKQLIGLRKELRSTESKSKLFIHNSN